MMDLDQRKKAEENMGLVYKVIRDRVKGPYELGIHDREDLVQTGCLGLCRAVSTDRGGCFSTYAYRLIWNEICDALKTSLKRWKNETASDELPHICHDGTDEWELHEALAGILKDAGQEAVPSVRKGILAMELMEEGYSSREIGERMGAPANLVCAWVSKARKYLREQPELVQLAEDYGYVQERIRKGRYKKAG